MNREYLLIRYQYSRYLDDNIRTHIRNPRPNLKEDETFVESNKMHCEDDTHRAHTQNATRWCKVSEATIAGVLWNVPCLQPSTDSCMQTWWVWTWKWVTRCTGTWWEWATTWTYTQYTGMDTVWNTRYWWFNYDFTTTRNVKNGNTNPSLSPAGRRSSTHWRLWTVSSYLPGKPVRICLIQSSLISNEM